MAIGISTACFYPENTEIALRRIGEGACTLAEVFFNASSELDSAFTAQLRAIQQAYQIQIKSLHTLAAFAESFYCFSAYERRFYDSLEVFRRYFYAAEQLGAQLVVLHGARPPLSISEAEYFERFGLLCRLGREHGVYVAQENIVKYCCESPAYLCRMRDAVGPDFSMVLDIKQARRAGYTPYDFTEKLAGNIRHIHISDFAGDRDCITPLTGEFDFAHFFAAMRQAGYSGDYIIELYRNSYAHAEEVFAAQRALQALL